MAKGTDIGTAYVQIVPSAQGISGSISKVLGGEAASAGESAGNSIGGGILSSIRKFVGWADVAKVIKGSIAAGADFEQAIGGIETIYDGAAGYMKNFAQDAYRTAGISATDYMNQATSFGAALVKSMDGDTVAAANLANQSIIDMADNSNKFGTSMESIQNAYQGFAKQNYTMLDNLKLGYGGTKSEMERLLSDATKLTGVKYDISNLSDVYEAIHVIQEDLGVTGTTAQEAATTISGSFASVMASFENVMANLATGGDLSKSLGGLSESVGTFLTDNIVPALTNIFVGLADNLPEILKAGMNLVIKLGEGIIQALPYLLDSLKQLGTDIVNKIKEIVPQMLDAGRNLVEGLWNGIKNATSWLLGKIKEWCGSILNGIKSFFGIASPSKLFRDEIGQYMALGLAEGYENAMPSVVDDINKANNALANDINTDLGVSMDRSASSKINNIAIEFTIDNSGKDITEEDVGQWADLLTSRINTQLGALL